MKLLPASALVAIALVASGCSGCSTLERVNHAISAPSRTLVDEKAVLAAEAAYGAALDTVTQGAKDGRIKGEDAAKVAALIRKAAPARKALEAALHGANATDLATRYADFKTIVTDLTAIGAK